MQQCKQLVCAFLLFIGFVPCAADAGRLYDFAQSFITHYDVRPEGRYVHEYHPFLLRETIRSWGHLEAQLGASGFNTTGRMVVVGYEENAVPSYYTDYTRSKINDEACSKNLVGWSQRLHNRFGFMTGFLFRSLELYAPHQTIFHHILAHPLHLFHSRAAIFQQHAFGQVYPLVRDAEARLIAAASRGDVPTVLDHLVGFWRTIYDFSLQVGNQQLAGTQDILFSIAYAEHLKQSSLPAYRFFVGPDITYPIEISNKYDRTVTDHAQRFVQLLVDELVPQHGEKTAYIFSSFVDGVGKSTMLGNIINWMTYGGELEKYHHVDNSSSQLATLFRFTDDVFIADLPAHISHFTYKPDGDVYVEARTELSSDEMNRLIDYARKERRFLVDRYHEMIGQVREASNAGCLLDEDRQHPDYAFIRNIVLLKKEDTNRWIPFDYEGKHYLFYNEEPYDLRLLVPLASVKSEGLKNIESEQMLFFDGIRLPLKYEHFIEDLVRKLHEAQVKNVVFVDFMSMYPRSSRENVRINYLLQQMAYLKHAFNPHESLYRTFVSGGELLHVLLNKQWSEKIVRTMSEEVAVRAALYDLIKDGALDYPHDWKMGDVTRWLRQKFNQYGPGDIEMITSLVRHKMHNESKMLYDLYGLSKDYSNIHALSFHHAHVFGALLAHFMECNVEHPDLTCLWKGIEERSMTCIDGKIEDQRVLGSCHQLCRDEDLITPMIRGARASWYATILNLVFSVKIASGRYQLLNEQFAVPPVYFVADTDHHIHCVQKFLEPWDGEISFFMQVPLQLFNIPLSQHAQFGKFGSKGYYLNWDQAVTNCGIFAYDARGSSHKKNKKNDREPSLVSMFLDKYQAKHGVATVMPLEKLMRKFEKSFVAELTQSRFKKQAYEHGFIYGLTAHEIKAKLLGDAPLKGVRKDHSMKIFLMHEDQRSSLKMVARLLATLEMVLKDPDADLVVRYGHRGDFRAALYFFERVLMPRYLGLYAPEPLFKDYTRVEPFPSWEFWDALKDHA